MKFRTFIYLDEDKLNNYGEQLLGVSWNSSKEIEVKTSAGGNFGIKGAKLGAEITQISNSEVTNNIHKKYDMFEETLNIKELNEGFIDLIETEIYELKTIATSSIIKLQSGFEVPLEFDIARSISMLKNFISKSIKTVENKEMIEQYIKNLKLTNIPICFEVDGIVLIGKLNIEYMKKSIEYFEDLYDTNLNILCKIENKRVTNGDVVVYDILRDFFHLDRQLRRRMPEEQSMFESGFSLKPITFKGPVFFVEIISIYA